MEIIRLIRENVLSENTEAAARMTKDMQDQNEVVDARESLDRLLIADSVHDPKSLRIAATAA